MKSTLLDLTQSVLSSLNSDEVNSISDTTESVQVAEIIKQVYNNMVARSNLRIHEELFQLDSASDSTKPVLMTLPDSVSKLEWVKYFRDDSNTDTSDGYEYVTVLPIQQYLDMINMLDTTQDNVDEFTFTDKGNSFSLKFRTDAQPCYCTVISDQWVIFDSFDSAVEDTLQSSKTLCYGQVLPVFTMEDDFVPDLDDKQFPLLLNEAKSLAFFELKQAVHNKAEQEAKRQWSVVQKNRSIDGKPSYFDQIPDFGRSRGNVLYGWGQKY